MNVDIEFGNDEDIFDLDSLKKQVDPDEFLAQNSFRIVYQTNNFFLPQIRDLIERRETINLRPEYQRRLRWTNIQKSKLIESLLLNIPVPPVFFYENEAARYEVMDGQQRLSAIRDFFAGDFALIGLTVLEPLNGIRYSKCPPRMKRTLDRSTISAVVLLLESEKEREDSRSITIDDIRRVVFDRLNTGGRTLNAQEIRNALNPGPFNDAVVRMSRNTTFTTIFGIPEYSEKTESDFYENPERQRNPLYKAMRDCELVLRYFALRDDRNIRGSMKSMLDRAMSLKLTTDGANLLENNYAERMSFLFDLFDKRPFVIPTGTTGTLKVSAALYDSAMVAIDRVWESRSIVQRDKVGVQSRLANALKDAVLYEIIVGRGNTAEAVKERINLLKSILLPAG